jgi:hypothetical protein
MCAMMEKLRMWSMKTVKFEWLKQKRAREACPFAVQQFYRIPTRHGIHDPMVGMRAPRSGRQATKPRSPGDETPHARL